jgi:hypothetical protein
MLTLKCTNKKKENKMEYQGKLDKAITRIGKINTQIQRGIINPGDYSDELLIILVDLLIDAENEKK